MRACPSCGRVDDEIGNCGSFLTCGKPNAAEVTPGTMAVVKCEPCNMTRVVSASDIVTPPKHARGLDFVCPSPDTCSCKVIPLKPAKAANAQAAQG